MQNLFYVLFCMLGCYYVIICVMRNYTAFFGLVCRNSVRLLYSQYYLIINLWYCNVWTAELLESSLFVFSFFKVCVLLFSFWYSISNFKLVAFFIELSGAKKSYENCHHITFSKFIFKQRKLRVAKNLTMTLESIKSIFIHFPTILKIFWFRLWY